MKKIILSYLSAALLLTAAWSCKEDNPPLPDNIINFESKEIGLENGQNTTDIQVTLNRAEATPVQVSIELTASKLQYGIDFSTLPEAVNNLIELTIPAGQTTAAIKVSKGASTVLNGDEQLLFTIKKVTHPIFQGGTTTLKVAFEAITSESGTLIGQGKTSESNYFNSVFFDLSGAQTSAVPRNSWNLGFSNGAFNRVILNSAYQTMVYQTSKNVLSDVGLSDADSVNFNFGPGEGTLNMVDDFSGDLSKTAIAEVATTAGDNKVYLLAFENNKTPDKIYKIRVTRSGNGYKLEYAKLADTVTKTVEIQKQSDYNFTFFSIETGKTVAFEPKASHWDIAWTYSTSNSGMNTPYWFQDFILINNVGGTQAAEIIQTTALTYDTFTQENLNDIPFSNARDTIGSKWRSTSGTTIGIKTDRFYLIKDPSGNIYKIKFVKAGLGGDGGERGKPEIAYHLLKKA